MSQRSRIKYQNYYYLLMSASGRFFVIPKFSEVSRLASVIYKASSTGPDNTADIYMSNTGRRRFIILIMTITWCKKLLGCPGWRKYMELYYCRMWKIAKGFPLYQTGFRLLSGIGPDYRAGKMGNCQGTFASHFPAALSRQAMEIWKYFKYNFNIISFNMCRGGGMDKTPP